MQNLDHNKAFNSLNEILVVLVGVDMVVVAVAFNSLNEILKPKTKKAILQAIKDFQFS